MEGFDMESFFLIGCPIAGLVLSFLWLLPQKGKVKTNYNEEDIET